MTKATQLAKERRFSREVLNEEEVKASKGGIPPRYGAIFRRDKKIEAYPATFTPCLVCKEKMPMSVGQIKITHGGACRKEFRANRSKYVNGTPAAK